MEDQVLKIVEHDAYIDVLLDGYPLMSTNDNTPRLRRAVAAFVVHYSVEEDINISSVMSKSMGNHLHKVIESMGVTAHQVSDVD